MADVQKQLMRRPSTRPSSVDVRKAQSLRSAPAVEPQRDVTRQRRILETLPGHAARSRTDNVQIGDFMKPQFLLAASLLAVAGPAFAQEHPKGPYTLFVVVAGANGASIAITPADTFDNETACLAAAKAVTAPAGSPAWSASGVCAPTGQGDETGE